MKIGTTIRFFNRNMPQIDKTICKPSEQKANGFNQLKQVWLRMRKYFISC